MVHLSPDEFTERIDAMNRLSELESRERATATLWTQFQDERLADFAKQLEIRGFSADSGGKWRHPLGWVEIAAIDWNRDNGVSDSLQLLSLWSYKVPNGSRLLRLFCESMDASKYGVSVCGVVRLFNHGLDGQIHEDESKLGGIQTVERLKRFYIHHFGFSECDEKSDEGRAIIVRTSPNYIPNPHQYKAETIKQESE